MDVYAALARYHMHRFGTTQRDIAEVSAKNHRHSALNPKAQYQDAMTADDVLAARERIIKRHQVYQKGYMWTLQNHPRIPEKIRAYYRQWGLPKDEFTANGGLGT